jgi:hypothetical protein
MYWLTVEKNENENEKHDLSINNPSITRRAVAAERKICATPTAYSIHQKT